MTITKKQAIEKLNSGNFPQILIEMFEGNEDPFDFELRSPFHVFNAPNLSSSLIPLFESGAFTYFFDEEKEEYIAFHLESPESKHLFGNSIQCLWAGIILNLYDDETTLPELKKLSKKIGFKYAQELHERMQDYMKTNTDYNDTKQAILNICKS